MTDAADQVQPVPPGVRVLHIGPPKTGSTVLQAAMHERREQMSAHGVRHLGSDRAGRQAVLAALMEDDFSPGTRPKLYRRWQRLQEEVDTAGAARVLVSNESMARVGDTGAKLMVESLGDERPHVIAVVRRLDKLLPSQWQEWVRIGRTALTYDAWLRVVLEDNPTDPQWQDFWTPHDLPRLLQRWASLAGGPDHVTLVVADEDDPKHLSRSFEGLFELPVDLLAPAETHRTNPSASLERIELVRRLNAEIADRDWPADTAEQLRAAVAKRIRSAPAWEGETRIPSLPAWAAETVASLNEKRAELVRSCGAQVVGDPRLLSPKLPAPSPAQGSPDEQASMVSLDLAVQSLTSLMAEAVSLPGRPPRGRGVHPHQTGSQRPGRVDDQARAQPGTSADKSAAGPGVGRLSALSRRLRRRPQ